MCVRVERVSAPARPWDADRLVISIPSGLSPELSVRALRAVLRELGAIQGEFGARCFCGAPLLGLGLIPQQRHTEEVIDIGA